MLDARVRHDRVVHAPICLLTLGERWPSDHLQARVRTTRAVVFDRGDVLRPVVQDDRLHPRCDGAHHRDLARSVAAAPVKALTGILRRVALHSYHELCGQRGASGKPPLYLGRSNRMGGKRQAEQQAGTRVRIRLDRYGSHATSGETLCRGEGQRIRLSADRGVVRVPPTPRNGPGMLSPATARHLGSNAGLKVTQTGQGGQD